MYKFTNGFIVFDEKTRNSLLKAGYKLINDMPKLKNKIVEKKETIEEIENDNESNNGVVKTKYKKNKAISKGL